MRYTDQRKLEIEEREKRAVKREKKIEPMTDEQRAALCIPVYHPHDRATTYPRLRKVLANKAQYMRQLGLRSMAELDAYIEKYQQPGR